jgi:mono/diheme cytochrome c family protein
MTQRSRLSTRATRAILSVGVVAAIAGCKSGGTAPPSPGAMPGIPSSPVPTASTGAGNAALTSTNTGVYTAAQATAGRELFAASCSGCHGSVTSIVVPDFRRRWTGQTLWALFDNIRQTMPGDNPKSLRDTDYAIALAYLMQSMRMPAGSVTLMPDSVALKKIRIDTVATSMSPRH